MYPEPTKGWRAVAADNTLRFDGQVAIVTGGGGGLGRAYATLLADRGAKVLVNDLGTTIDGSPGGGPGPQHVVEEITSRGGVAIGDVHDVASQGEEIVAAALEAWGRVDIVVAGAGMARVGRLADAPMDAWRKSIEVGLYGTVGVLHHAWPSLASNAGRVVTVTSSSVCGQAGVGPYAASKAAIIGLTRGLALEGKADGIRVNAVMPIAYSRMTSGVRDEAFVEMMRTEFQPERVAAFVGYLAHESVQVSGETFTVGGGRAARVFLGIAPGWGSGDVAPEDFGDHIDDVLAVDGHRVISSSGEELRWKAERLGLEVAHMPYMQQT
jgi:NAD(P)-dependent dehydrogenase (short-subunit alcohol dehydrogenase family)